MCLVLSIRWCLIWRCQLCSRITTIELVTVRHHPVNLLQLKGDLRMRKTTQTNSLKVLSLKTVCLGVLNCQAAISLWTWNLTSNPFALRIHQLSRIVQNYERAVVRCQPRWIIWGCGIRKSFQSLSSIDTHRVWQHFPVNTQKNRIILFDIFRVFLLGRLPASWILGSAHNPIKGTENSHWTCLESGVDGDGATTLEINNIGKLFYVLSCFSISLPNFNHQSEGWSPKVLALELSWAFCFHLDKLTQ